MLTAGESNKFKVKKSTGFYYLKFISDYDEVNCSEIGAMSTGLESEYMEVDMDVS